MKLTDLLGIGLAALLAQAPSLASGNALERIEVGEGDVARYVNVAYVYQCRDLVIELRHQFEPKSRNSQFSSVLVNGRRLKSHRLQLLNARLPADSLALMPGVTCLTRSVGLWIPVKVTSEHSSEESAFRFRFALSEEDLESP